MTERSKLTSTYRLQFNREFTFDDARKIIPYLHKLGVTHVYASPFFKARAGSMHGYDIVDHNALNPEIGNANDFHTYVETLHEFGMGQIIDIVPNHRGVGGDDNMWWLDVLENGEASRYANYFDIDWHPVNSALRNKVLLPFLGNYYGTVLDNGELQLKFDPDKGAFSVYYYDHRFPIDPQTYHLILNVANHLLAQQNDIEPRVTDELNTLINDFRTLPRRTSVSSRRRQQRREKTAEFKKHLALLTDTRQCFRDCIEQALTGFNGTPENPGSFDMLHRLLELQAYRLAYWLVAADEINYRRFFDINDLAGVRVEQREVFDENHRLIKQLIRDDQVDGLRIDHPDGLTDPYRYYCDLQKLIRENRADDRNEEIFPIFVEKILASYERLPTDWPVSGTTGYETAFLLNGLLVYPGSERDLTLLYERITGNRLEFDELLYESKRKIMRSALASELTVLANLLYMITRRSRHTRDLTYHGLRSALAEIVACFPVYRTYITQKTIGKEDRRFVQWAIAQAKKRSLVADVQVFDFIASLLIYDFQEQYSTGVRRRINQFCLRFQQYTSPVMAKGMEDTSFYIFNHLVSLNDVGFNPRVYAISVDAFHYENLQRFNQWPNAMVGTSTHDSKRGEDVRARINVLSEVPGEWKQHLARWKRFNRGKKRRIDDRWAPFDNDEYLLYQTLIGCWPVEPLDEDGLGVFRQRTHDYMLKAIREAKAHTSWLNPNEEYEEAMHYFVDAVLTDPERNPFLTDFLPFQRRLVRFGLLNSLSQTLLKLTVPGIPDVYQGNELWAFNLVDPDNRQPVDYSSRCAALDELIRGSENGGLPSLLRNCVENLDDGRAKLYITWKTLCLRRENPEIFIQGDYCGLAVQGPAAEHICAFARAFDGREIIVAAPRWFARLAGGSEGDPLAVSGWAGTVVQAVDGAAEKEFYNVFSGRITDVFSSDGVNCFRASDLFKDFPVALLVAT